MEAWKRNLWVLWFAAFIGSASLTMVIPFLPLFLLQLGVHDHTEMWNGLLFSSTFLASAITSPFLGSLADRFGRKKMIIRAGLVLFIVFTLTSIVTNPYQLLALRIFHGLLAGYIPAVIALIGTNTPEHKAGYALSMISTAMASGRIMGPLLGGGIAKLFDNRIAFASAGLLILLSTLLVIFMVTEDKIALSKERVSVFGAFKIAASNRALTMVLILTVITSIAVMTIEPVITLYIVALGGSAQNSSFLAGFVFSLAGIAGILFASRWGRLADKIGFRNVLMIGLLGGALGTFAQIAFHNIWGFAIVRFVYGVFFCAVVPCLNGLVVRFTTSDFRGRAFSLNQTATQTGNMIGPIIGGMIGSAWSIHSIFWVTGIILIFSIVLTNSLTEVRRTEKTNTVIQHHS
ncbi:MFS transporter [Paenibacillus sp. GP183]|uniref:MFS transporter n=1 Tax=Paenibacillus sp. GP183 TaxID=1882751 RepID=UPI000894561C|nr:MFS transporter [Paenibacillus sp. GP183]SEC82559.1 Predicted arabinose efflux permease, MFS family [Paenibacillus sp. GP183]